MAQYYCKFTIKVKSTSESSTLRDQDYYFLGSSLYENTTIATRTGISNIKRADWDKSNVLTPVANIVRAGLLERLTASVETTATNGKTAYKEYDILVDAEKSLDVKDGGDGKELAGLPYAIKDGKGEVKTKGTIRRVGKRTQAVNRG